MKDLNFLYVLAAGALLAIGLPSSHVRSQLAPLPADPLVLLQSVQTTNDDLLKRQEATLKELTDMTETSREVRIYSRRG